MKKLYKLTKQMYVFYIIILILLFIVIISNKKLIISSKIEEKINTYINKNYKDLKKELKISKLKINNKTYYKQLSNKSNKNLFFIVKYKNKKITSTYNNNYIKGNNFIKIIEKNIKKDIFNLTKEEFNIKLTNTLDNYPKTIKDKIIKNNKLYKLKIYNINHNLYISNWTKEELIKKIKDLNKILKDNKINYANLNLKIKNTNKSYIINVSNITSKIIENNNFSIIINDIMNLNNSKIIKENNIKIKEE